VTRRFRRIVQIRRAAALALAVSALAAPAAVADTPTGQDQLAIEPAPVSFVSPDTRDAARPQPQVSYVSPDARDAGRRKPAPVVVSPPAVAASDGFDWAAAGIGAAGVALLLLLGAGAATMVRTRRAPVRAH
jgi:hypothetical protein